MKAIFSFLKKSGFFLCVLLTMLGLTSVLYLNPRNFGEDESAEAFAEHSGVPLHIVMYHSIAKDRNRWGTYVISPDEFESDLKLIKSRGYTTVTVQNLIDYVYDGKALPEKPIMITLDDGYYNNYLYAYPLLKQYNMKAVISIVGKYTDVYSLAEDKNSSYAHLTWKEVNEMIDSGVIEIQNHSYDLHSVDQGRRGSMKVSGETAGHYRTVLVSDAVRLQALIKANTGYTPGAYTYPYGLISSESTGILKEIGFKASLSCYSGVNRITRDPECLFLLKRLLRPHGKALKDVLPAS